MKIAVLSDTHIRSSKQPLPPELMEAFRTVDMVIHAGDIVDPSVLIRIKSVCPNVRAVCGNMDPPELHEQLPQKEIIQVGKFRVGVMHGHGTPNGLIDILSAEFKKDKVDMVIFGHSHMPINREIDTILFFNPGSPTDTVFAQANSYGMIEIGDTIVARIVFMK